MSTAWETTAEDIQQVLDAHDLDLSADDIHDDLNHDDIEDAALFADELDDQQRYALQEIEHQLIGMGHLPEGTSTKFSDDSTNDVEE